MDKRKITLSALGVLLIVAAVFGAKAIIDSKEQPEANVRKTVKTVFVDTIQNSTISINIPANGNLVAKQRVELLPCQVSITDQTAMISRPTRRYPKLFVFLAPLHKLY